MDSKELWLRSRVLSENSVWKTELKISGNYFAIARKGAVVFYLPDKLLWDRSIVCSSYSLGNVFFGTDVIKLWDTLRIFKPVMLCNGIWQKVINVMLGTTVKLLFWNLKKKLQALLLGVTYLIQASKKIVGKLQFSGVGGFIKGFFRQFF